MTFLKPLVASLAIVLSAGAHAQGASAPASPAKKALVAKLIQLQQPGIENVARLLVEQPALQLMQQAAIALQRLPAERRQAVGQDIQADVRKYVEDTVPGVRDRAVKLAPATIGPMLEERFSENELKQLISIIESPVNKKYQSMGGEFQRALGEKVVSEMRPEIDPRLRALQQSMATRLGVAPSPAASAASR
jgi:uncharacterized protein